MRLNGLFSDDLTEVGFKLAWMALFGAVCLNSARAETTAGSIYSGGPITVAKEVIADLDACFKGKSDAEKVTGCLIPKARPITEALPDAIRAFIAYIPDDVRSKCNQGKTDTATVMAEIRCMFESLEPPVPRASQNGERVIQMLAAANTYLWGCQKLGATAAPQAAADCKFPPLPTPDSVAFNPNLPKEEGYSSKDILGGALLPSAGKKGASGTSTGLFSSAGTGCGAPVDCSDLGGNELIKGFGISAQCLNTFVCDEAFTLARFFPNAKDISLVQAAWLPRLEKLKKRYSLLRAEILKRLLRQIQALAAAEATSCDATNDDVAANWASKIVECPEVGATKIATQQLLTPEAKKRAREICEANAGGDAKTKAKYAESIRRDARTLLEDGCALRFIQTWPHAGAAESRDDQVAKAEQWRSNFASGSCAGVATRAQERARTIAGMSTQFPLPYPGDGADIKDGLVDSALSQYSCVQTGTNAKLAGLSESELADIANGKKDAPGLTSSKVFQDLVNVFNRACADRDDRGDFMRSLGGEDTGAFSLDQLESLVGNLVPEGDDASDEMYQFLKRKVAKCNAETRTKSGMESTLDDLERACGAFAAISTGAAVAGAATGGAALAGIAAVNAACAVPSLGKAKIESDKKNALTAFRRSMGNQISCDDAAALMKAEAGLDSLVASDVIAGALQAGLSMVEVVGIVRAAGSAAKAEARLAARMKAIEDDAAALKLKYPELKKVDPAEVRRLAAGAGESRPVRTSFPPGESGDAAFANAVKEHDAAIQQEVKKLSAEGDPNALPGPADVKLGATESKGGTLPLIEVPEIVPGTYDVPGAPPVRDTIPAPYGPDIPTGPGQFSPKFKAAARIQPGGAQWIAEQEARGAMGFRMSGENYSDFARQNPRVGDVFVDADAGRQLKVTGVSAGEPRTLTVVELKTGVKSEIPLAEFREPNGQYRNTRPFSLEPRSPLEEYEYMAGKDRALSREVRDAESSFVQEEARARAEAKAKGIADDARVPTLAEIRAQARLVKAYQARLRSYGVETAIEWTPVGRPRLRVIPERSDPNHWLTKWASLDKLDRPVVYLDPAHLPGGGARADFHGDWMELNPGNISRVKPTDTDLHELHHVAVAKNAGSGPNKVYRMTMFDSTPPAAAEKAAGIGPATYGPTHAIDEVTAYGKNYKITSQRMQGRLASIRARLASNPGPAETRALLREIDELEAYQTGERATWADIVGRFEKADSKLIAEARKGGGNLTAASGTGRRMCYYEIDGGGGVAGAPRKGIYFYSSAETTEGRYADLLAQLDQNTKVMTNLRTDIAADESARVMELAELRATVTARPH